MEAEDWARIIPAISNGEVAEAQIGAWLMAVLMGGLETAERAAYTRQMIASGPVLQWPDIDGVVADKHSTGGVGDKLSLIWAPLVVEAGVSVPMISGRGLGHTGGTLDKLEAIPGYQAILSPDRIRQVMGQVGCVICGQTDKMVPADRVLYDMRNRTATVPTVDHIAPSIMSKKLSEGLDRLVLDVKCGTGAFMKNLEDARTLAQVMVDLGEAVGCRVTALLTNMNTPLGRYVGHAAEVHESLQLLEGGGPADSRELVLALAREVVPEGDLESLLDSGRARERFARMIAAQGGDLEAMRWPDGVQAVELICDRAAAVSGLDALGVGLSLAELGGARTGDDQPPDPQVAVEILVKPGDAVERGQPWARLWHRDSRGLTEARHRMEAAFQLGDPAECSCTPLIFERVEGQT